VNRTATSNKARWALPLVLCACHGPIDTVATSYGDYDPKHPPVLFEPRGASPMKDPTMVRWGDTYWVFSTGPGISRSSSKDLLTFQKGKQVFAQNPAWIASAVPDASELWSPDVHVWNGLIHLYYAASSYGSRRSCIGHATSTSAEQDFVDDGKPIVCSAATDNYNAIDPAILLDQPDEPWMVFGSWDSGIKLIALDREGRRRDDGLHSVAARSADNPAIQAASLYHFRDYYYLFVSFDGSPNHTLRVGRAKQVTGPYTDRDDVAMTNGGGSILLAGNGTTKGPGSNTIVDEPGRRLDVYHAYDTNDVPMLRIAELFFDENGWPVTGGP
jgi:arabinan endo-1,5-alpha-L-arabinosidase